MIGFDVTTRLRRIHMEGVKVGADALHGSKVLQLDHQYVAVSYNKDIY